MSPAAQRIAIAEACGWNELTVRNGCQIGWPPTGRRGYREHLPDYLNDLNAMHEAETTLTDPQMSAYERELGRLCCKLSMKPGPGYNNWHATAAQRAEAFLKAKGLWKE